MSTTTLHMAPGTCARVCCIALEEVGIDFDTELVRFMKGQHKSPDYLALNPKGKVPLLLMDGEALSENLAILSYLNARFPAAGLLPPATDELARARQLADLSFCASTLHPIVSRIRIPHFFAPPEAARGVYEKACAAMDEYFALINGRLSGGRWWYEEQWSVMDAYIYWIFWRCAGADYDTSRFPDFEAHASRMESRESTRRAVARESAMEEQLREEGLLFTPPPVPAAANVQNQ